MKRLAFCLALLVSPGCMLADDYCAEEVVWYDMPATGCEVRPGAVTAGPARIAPTAQVVPLGGVVPAGGVVPPPPGMPQTREPELLRR